MDRNHYNQSLNKLKEQIDVFKANRENGKYERRISALTYTYNTLKSIENVITS